MARNFYFGSDSAMVSGSARFSAAIQSNPAELGLSVELCDGYAAIDAELQAAYLEAITPATRSPVAVERKNALIWTMQRAAVSLARIINATPSVSDAQLISLGLLPRPKRTRRNAPGEAPTVRVVSVIGRVAKIRIYDGGSPTHRRKAIGAIGAQIFSYVGEDTPADAREYHYEGFASRTTTEVTFPNDVPSGSTIWLSARWISKRGETSVASAPLRFTLQGGPVAAMNSELKIAA